MSKLSYFLFTVLVIWIAAMGAYRGWQYYAAYTEKANASRDNAPLFSVVNADTSPDGATQPYSTMAAVMPGSQAQTAAQDYAVGVVPPSYKDNVIEQPSALPVITKNQELQNRAEKVYAKYSTNPLIKSFNQDLQKAGVKNIDFTKLAGGDFPTILQQNPQLQTVLLKYSQDPQFLLLLQQMISDPEVAALTKELQVNNKN
ncbi:hypothetical protein AAIR98_000489 [Elusimicrobium simillimum]|uniref:hypothetical protein n=1 Tax=Elusimicrobium simillimum TaxID=3143438 RepID=UPI003C6FAF06